MPGKILVTPRSVTAKGHPSLSRLNNAGLEVLLCSPGVQPSEDELVRLIPGCVGYLAGVEKVTTRVLGVADSLKVISRNGTGIDNIDVSFCERKNIIIRRAEGANARGVAELTATLMLAMARTITFHDRSLKSNGWERQKGFELPGKTLGLLGCGKVGKLVTHLALAFGMKVVAYDPFPDNSFERTGFNYTDKESVLAHADIISLHCPAPKNGNALIGKAEISRLKKGVCLINTARAELIDESTIIEALDSGHVAGLAVDVFPEEPPRDRRLANHAKVIATPHIGGLTKESVDRAMDVAVDNLLESLK